MRPTCSGYWTACLQVGDADHRRVHRQARAGHGGDLDVGRILRLQERAVASPTQVGPGNGAMSPRCHPLASARHDLDTRATGAFDRASLAEAALGPVHAIGDGGRSIGEQRVRAIPRRETERVGAALDQVADARLALRGFREHWQHERVRRSSRAGQATRRAASDESRSRDASRDVLDAAVGDGGRRRQRPGGLTCRTTASSGARARRLTRLRS